MKHVCFEILNICLCLNVIFDIVRDSRVLTCVVRKGFLQALCKFLVDLIQFPVLVEIKGSFTHPGKRQTGYREKGRGEREREGGQVALKGKEMAEIGIEIEIVRD